MKFSNQSSLSLLTDLYQITMAYGYWKTGLHNQEAAFNLFFRHTPFDGGYVVSAGLATVIEYISAFRFTPDDLSYLQSLTTEQGKPLFEKQFLNYLKNLKFECDIDAMEEGEIVFPYEPLLRIKGPLLQCQLFETPFLNILNFQSLIATKASRVCQAANWEPIIEFGLRRAQGVNGGLAASRAAYIGGCFATSNTLAGKLYDIPVRGTHAHSWVMAFSTELESFQAYAKALPDNCILLVDTYNTLQGVARAIEVGKWLRKQGKKLLGIRLDSGDLAKLSRQARQLLNKAGFKEAVIVGSGDLDEYSIADLKMKKSQIDIWGVGTRLVTAYDQPALDGVYKLAAIRKPDGTWQYKFKLSENLSKTSVPGLLKVRRYFLKEKAFIDVIYDEQLGIPTEFTAAELQNPKRKKKISAKMRYSDLMKAIFKSGKLVYKTPSLVKSQQKTLTSLKNFAAGIKRFNNPEKYLVAIEAKLEKIKADLIVRARRGEV